MRRAAGATALSMLFLCLGPLAAEGQTWPREGDDGAGIEWMIGGTVPVSGLGSFAGYRIVLDGWPTVGASFGNGDRDDRVRTRFEITASPNVAMRRAPSGRGEAPCEDCTPDSIRHTLISARYLVDLGFPFGEGSRVYATGGPVMRFQLSDPEECPSSAGAECALPQFARARIDPGLMAGVGWQPRNRWIDAVQLAGRMSLYGRGERPEEAPNDWLPELDLTIRFNLDP